MGQYSKINNKLIEVYKEHIKEYGLKDELYKWELISKYIGRPNFLNQNVSDEMKAIDYGNLLYPIAGSVIKHMANAKPNEFSSVLNQLFNENIELNNRIKNYIKGAEVIYESIKTDKRKNHYQDERTIATLLAFQNPDKYAFFKDSFYQKYCKLIGIVPKGKNEKYNHYLNLLKEFKIDIRIDNEIQALINSILPKEYYKDKNLNILAQDILYQTLDVLSIDKNTFDINTKNSNLKKDKNSNTVQVMNPLNQILYGPPGTGKTYNTINKALEILGESKLLENGNRNEIKKKYDEYVNSGQIVFTTFHQSMSYEDFIEGIKPNVETEDDKDNLNYEIKPGIFKLICEKAKEIVNVSVKVDWDSPKYFKMSLGGKHRPEIYNYCIANNRISLGYGGDQDLKPFLKFKKWVDYKDEFTKVFPEIVKHTRYNIQATYAFLNMKVGDIVVVSKGNHIIDAIGVVKSDYYFDNNSPIEFAHFRDVEWIATDLNISPERFINKKISQMSIYEFYKVDIKYEAFKALTVNTASEKKKYVIIIDEINRGNVSQIFGELITLIEEDKRHGKSEAIELVLPYSKSKFSVPDNVYIIGTMNTADRSVEALDTALRRRFVFQEILPNVKFLEPFLCLYRLWLIHQEKKWTDKQWKAVENKYIKISGLKIINKNLYQRIENQLLNYEEQLDFDYSKAFSFDGINLAEMVTTINKRIELLIGKDHQIGHAFFMNVFSIDDLICVFEDKIIPLLQEYFYGDIGKISLVLGDSFIQKNNGQKTLFASKQYDAGLIQEFESRFMYSFTDSEQWDFKSIYE